MAGRTSPKSVSPKPSPTGEQHAGSNEGVDRRVHKRYEINLGGALSRDGIQFVPCRIHDFCLGGMLVVPGKFSGEDVLVGGKPVVKGDRLIVRCVANVGDEELDHTVRGRALRVSSRGIGIAFERNDPDEVWRVTQLVRELTEVLRNRREQERSARMPGSPVVAKQTVNARQLLEDMRRRIERFLVSGMKATFQEADHWLFAQANEDAIDSDRRTAFYEAMKELKRLKVPIGSAFLDTINRALKGLGRPASQSASRLSDEGKTELSLMDTGNFDDWLAIKDIISAAEPFLTASQYRIEQLFRGVEIQVGQFRLLAVHFVPKCLIDHLLGSTLFEIE